MKNPQKENGNTQISNELLEAIIAMTNLTATEFACLLFLIRKTYGWNKKYDAISISQFIKATGRCRRGVCYALKSLRVQRIALVQQTAQGATVYGLNKHFDEWIVQRIALVQKNDQGSAKESKLVVQEIAHTKDTLTKDNIQKTIVRPLSDISIKLSEILLNYILLNNPNFKHNNKTVPRWAKDIDLMLRLDKRQPDEVKMIIQFCQADTFWRKNILSGNTLRRQYDKLWLGAKEFISNNQHYVA